MFDIVEYNEQVEAKELKHSTNVFHEAILDGDRYYHITGNNFKYDILYKGNTEWFGDIVPAYIKKIVPEYLEYDENDKELLDIEFLNNFSKYIIVHMDEYSIAVARAVLRYTNRHVYSSDQRVLWFLEENDRLHIGQIPSEDEKTVYLVGVRGGRFVKGEPIISKMSNVFMFHSLFYFQNLYDKNKKDNIKYLEYPMSSSSGGIGGLLSQTAYLTSFADDLGLRLCYNGDTIGKFKVSDLSKYFKLDFKREDNTENNTIRIDSLVYLNTLWRYYVTPCVLSTNIIQDKFYKELEEYTNAIIGGKKSLGIIIRGTDYLKVGFSGSRKQATVDEMVPMIKEWIDKDGYEVIALATEDKDILEQMVNEFGDKVVAIAQERHSSTEFKQGQIINDFEKQIYSKDEYDEHVIDTTINYFYALYLLSKCNAFMSSGHNNGWDTVNAMNVGRFEKTYKFVVDKTL